MATITDSPRGDAEDVATRLAVLEEAVAKVRAQVGALAEARPWYVAQAGLFSDDADFDEIVRLGREFRESQKPSE